MSDWKFEKIGPEPKRSFTKRMLPNGLYTNFCIGIGVDVGYGGNDSCPAVPWAEGVDKDTPGYNGTTLPYSDNTLDFLFSSHALEHINDYTSTLREWWRVIKTNGHMIVIVPHQYLYEKKAEKPSRFNDDHKRFYTPASLLHEIEQSLQPNSYRVRWLRDNDDDFLYSLPPEQHSAGCYEIELVLQKIVAPEWGIK